MPVDVHTPHRVNKSTTATSRNESAAPAATARAVSDARQRGAPSTRTADDDAQRARVAGAAAAAERAQQLPRAARQLRAQAAARLSLNRRADERNSETNEERTKKQERKTVCSHDVSTASTSRCVSSPTDSEQANSVIGQKASWQAGAANDRNAASPVRPTTRKSTTRRRSAPESRFSWRRWRRRCARARSIDDVKRPAQTASSRPRHRPP